MAHNQLNLLGDELSSLLGDVKPAPQTYVPKPQHVRSRFIDFPSQKTVAET